MKLSLLCRSHLLIETASDRKHQFSEFHILALVYSFGYDWSMQTHPQRNCAEIVSKSYTNEMPQSLRHQNQSIIHHLVTRGGFSLHSSPGFAASLLPSNRNPSRANPVLPLQKKPPFASCGHHSSQSLPPSTAPPHQRENPRRATP